MKLPITTTQAVGAGVALVNLATLGHAAYKRLNPTPTPANTPQSSTPYSVLTRIAKVVGYSITGVTFGISAGFLAYHLSANRIFGKEIPLPKDGLGTIAITIVDKFPRMTFLAGASLVAGTVGLTSGFYYGALKA